MACGPKELGGVQIYCVDWQFGHFAIPVLDLGDLPRFNPIKFYLNYWGGSEPENVLSEQIQSICVNEKCGGGLIYAEERESKGII